MLTIKFTQHENNVKTSLTHVINNVKTSLTHVISSPSCLNLSYGTTDSRLE